MDTVADREREHEIWNQIVNDKYQIRSKLGDGGEGAVYEVALVPETTVDPGCVVKLAPFPFVPSLRSGDHQVINFLRGEFRTAKASDWFGDTGLSAEQRDFIKAILIAASRRKELANLMLCDHPNILKCVEGGACTVVDGGNERKMFYYVLERAQTTLEQRLDPSYGHLSLEDRWALTRDVAQCIGSALVYLADLNLVHRDIKPANVLLCNGVWKLSDFGLSLEVNGITVFVLGAAGTDRYAAPEQMQQGEGIVSQVSPRTDIYSAGLVLWELLLGGLPSDKSPQGLLKALQSLPDTPSGVESHPLLKAMLMCIEPLSGNRCWPDDIVSAAQVRAQRGLEFPASLQMGRLDLQRAMHKRRYRLEKVPLVSASLRLPPGYSADWKVETDRYDGQTLLYSLKINRMVREELKQVGIEKAAEPYQLPSHLPQIREWEIDRRNRRGELLKNSENKVILASDLIEDVWASGSTVLVRQGGYFDGLATNELTEFVLSDDDEDQIVFDGSTMVAAQNQILRLDQTWSACHIGISSFYITADDWLVYTQQKKNAAVHGEARHEGDSKNRRASWLPSSSGSANWEDGENTDRLEDIVVKGMMREFKEECTRQGIDPANTYTKVVGYARLLNRGGKPEFFGLGTTPLLYGAITSDDPWTERHELIKLQSRDSVGLRAALREGLEKNTTRGTTQLRYNSRCILQWIEESPDEVDRFLQHE